MHLLLAGVAVEDEEASAAAFGAACSVVASMFFGSDIGLRGGTITLRLFTISALCCSVGGNDGSFGLLFVPIAGSLPVVGA